MRSKESSGILCNLQCITFGVRFMLKFFGLQDYIVLVLGVRCTCLSHCSCTSACEVIKFIL